MEFESENQNIANPVCNTGSRLQNFQLHSNQQDHTFNTPNPSSTNIQPSHIYYSIPNSSFYYPNNNNPSTINAQYASAYHQQLSASYNDLQQTDTYNRYPNTLVTTIHYSTSHNHPSITTVSPMKQYQYQQTYNISKLLAKPPQQKYCNDRQNSIMASSSITQTSRAQSGHNSNFRLKDIQQQQLQFQKPTTQSQFYLNQDTRNTTTPTLYLNSLNQNKPNLWSTADATYGTHVFSTSSIHHN